METEQITKESIERYVKKEELFPNGSLFGCTYCSSVYDRPIPSAVRTKNVHERGKPDSSYSENLK